MAPYPQMLRTFFGCNLSLSSYYLRELFIRVELVSSVSVISDSSSFPT